MGLNKSKEGKLNLKLWIFILLVMIIALIGPKYLFNYWRVESDAVLILMPTVNQDEAR